MLQPYKLGGAVGHGARPCWSLELGLGSCLPCIAPGRVFPEVKPSSPRLNSRFTSKSYSQINSINLGDSHFITPGSSVHCLPQGEAAGAGKGWKNQLPGELEQQGTWPGPALLWDNWGHGRPDPTPALAAHLGFLRLC